MFHPNMLAVLMLSVTLAAPTDSPDGGSSAALAEPATLHTERFTLKGPLQRWLAATRSPGAGEAQPEVRRLGGLTAFQDGDRTGVVVEQTRAVIMWTAEPFETPMVVLTLPGARSGLLVCGDVACGDDDSRCSKAMLDEHRRRCTWVAPLCAGVSAVDLSSRFQRLSLDRGVIIADVFNNASPTCAPGDGPSPRWNTQPVRMGSWGPSSLLRGTLQPHACAPPTWLHTVGHFVLYEEGNEGGPVDPVYGRLMPSSTPRCP